MVQQKPRRTNCNRNTCYSIFNHIHWNFQPTMYSMLASLSNALCILNVHLVQTVVTIPDVDKKHFFLPAKLVKLLILFIYAVSRRRTIKKRTFAFLKSTAVRNHLTDPHCAYISYSSCTSSACTKTIICKIDLIMSPPDTTAGLWNQAINTKTLFFRDISISMQVILFDIALHHSLYRLPSVRFIMSSVPMLPNERHWIIWLWNNPTVLSQNGIGHHLPRKASHCKLNDSLVETVNSFPGPFHVW